MNTSCADQSSTTEKEKPPQLIELQWFSEYGGEIGARILGIGEGATDFESIPLGHSGTSPTAGAMGNTTETLSKLRL